MEGAGEGVVGVVIHCKEPQHENFVFEFLILSKSTWVADVRTDVFLAKIQKRMLSMHVKIQGHGQHALNGFKHMIIMHFKFKGHAKHLLFLKCMFSMLLMVLSTCSE